ncbi:MAG TPA: M36 family metallopeptidase [Flavobacteriales bacterium]|nr:M36 family metallopeptidase [Flavobacteriales bacterium]
MRTHTLAYLLPLTFFLSDGSVFAQGLPETGNITFITDNKRLPDRDRQIELRSWGGWPAFHQLHPRWTAEFNEETGLPRRAYGDPIATVGATAADRALHFLQEELAAYHLPLEELNVVSTAPGKKLTYVHFEQRHAGLPVLGTKVQVKLDAEQRVIAFATDLARDIAVSTTPTVPVGVAADLAQEGLTGVESTADRGLALLPMTVAGQQRVRLVHRIQVLTRIGDRPGRYDCLVDATDGRLLYRANAVRNCGHDDGDDDEGVELSMSTLAYTGSPLVAPTVQAMPELNVTINGTLFQTDISGYLNSGVPGPATGIIQLRGRWAAVRTNTVTPAFNTTLNEGFNARTFDNNANLRERSAYLYVNQIHSHMKTVLPDFTGMDYQIATNLDLTTDNCNAFYDGSSINFYAEANNCRSLATINDVVYHEYGHGINDKFYSALSSDFSNGAMDEGYADVWGLTLTQSPILGLGINLDNDNSTVRRYDEDPKVYPDHIVGEVHADGEIIAGAWWDLYEGLGQDMLLTLDLFAQAYPGLQANTFNGNEGQAYRDMCCRRMTPTATSPMEHRTVQPSWKPSAGTASR